MSRRMVTPGGTDHFEDFPEVCAEVGCIAYWGPTKNVLDEKTLEAWRPMSDQECPEGGGGDRDR